MFIFLSRKIHHKAFFAQRFLQDSRGMILHMIFFTGFSELGVEFRA
jgi:hypothetical protein